MHFVLQVTTKFNRKDFPMKVPDGSPQLDLHCISSDGTKVNQSGQGRNFSESRNNSSVTIIRRIVHSQIADFVFQFYVSIGLRSVLLEISKQNLKEILRFDKFYRPKFT